MDILVEFTGENGKTQRLQINDAPQGTEIVVLEQFLAGPSHLSRMISEAGEGPQEPENAEAFLPEFRIDRKSPVEESLFAIRETIEKAKEDASRSGRTENNPLNILDRSNERAKQQAKKAGTRIQRTKQIRAVNNLQQAAKDCLKVLEGKIQEDSMKANRT